MAKSNVQGNQTCLGLMDFVTLPMQTTPQWAVIALESDFASAAAAVKAVCRPKQVWTDPEVKFEGILKGGPSEAFTLGALLGLTNGPWITLVRSVGFLTLDLLFTVREEARDLSLHLQSRALASTRESTSGCLGYEICERGTLVEKAEWDRSGFTCWGSNLRAKPELNGATLEFADALFRQYGIYVPGCCLAGALNRPGLRIATRSKQCIDSVRLFDIRDRRTPPFPKLLAARKEKLASLRYR